MYGSRNLLRLPPELIIHIFADAAWKAAARDNNWLSSLATTSRLVWAIVKPILYHTVVLTNDNLPKLHAAVDCGNFALTRRVVCRIQVGRGERHPLRALDIIKLANAFNAVEYFYSTEEELSIFRRPGEEAFAPRQVTLLLADDFTTVKDFIKQTRSARGITHLHLVLNICILAWPRGLPRADPTTLLTHVILEPLKSAYWDERLLVSRILPFLLACPVMERVLVRAPRDATARESTRRALEGFVRARNEQRIWVLDAQTKRIFARSLFKVKAAFDAGKWTAGRQLLSSL